MDIDDIEIYKNRAITKYANISLTHLAYVKFKQFKRVA